MPAGYPVTAYAMCNALGARTRDAIAALSEGRSGLEPPPFELPFETVAGAVPGELPALPAAVSGWDARVTRIALIALAELSEPVSRAIRRWGKDRVAVVLGTSTGGLESTERAYAAHHQSGRLPAWYDYDLQHPFHAFADLVAHVTGAGGPTYVVSTACSTSTKVLGSAMRLIGAGVADAVLVGGVDSLIAESTLARLDAEGLLGTSDRDGLTPSEAAAFALIRPAASGVCISDARYSENADVLRGAESSWLLTDLDGTPAKNDAFADLVVAAGGVRFLRRDDLVWLYGDVGAASVPLLAVHAACAHAADFAPADRSIVLLSADAAERRGAVVLEVVDA